MVSKEVTRQLVPEQRTALSMRELGKLTAQQVAAFDQPVPVTSDGAPVAWLVPLTASERRRAEMIAEGTLQPRRRDELDRWTPEPAVDSGEPSLSELLLTMRDQERT